MRDAMAQRRRQQQGVDEDGKDVSSLPLFYLFKVWTLDYESE
jgi:hypothetical protein